MNSNWKKFKTNNTGKNGVGKGFKAKSTVPLNQIKSKSKSKSKSKTTSASTSASTSQHAITKIVAMDCEMVGVGVYKKSALARICIVNAESKVIYDRYTMPSEEITDYRTKYSGIRKKDLIGAPPFHVVQQEVAAILQNKVLVGHGLENDLRCLLIAHPPHMIRDTAHYKPLKIKDHRNSNKLISAKLKYLVHKHLDHQIQSGEHSPDEDAIAALMLYYKFKAEWENSLQKRHRSNDVQRNLVNNRNPSVFKSKPKQLPRPNKHRAATDPPSKKRRTK